MHTRSNRPDSYNAIIETPYSQPSDDVLFFGDTNGRIDDLDIAYLAPETTWPDILVDTLHIFNSRAQCRKAGWRTIAYGWTEVSVGKPRIKVAFLKAAAPPSEDLTL